MSKNVWKMKISFTGVTMLYNALYLKVYEAFQYLMYVETLYKYPLQNLMKTENFKHYFQYSEGIVIISIYN